MQAVILAAGLGTRLRPLTDSMPKPMLPIHGRPILEHTINSLPETINHILLVIHYLGEQIRNYFGETFGNKRVTYVRQVELRGTADALFACRDFLEPGKFLICMADDLYSRTDLERCLKFDLAILAFEHSEPWRFGVLETDGAGFLVDIMEKPEKPLGNLVNTGVYVLDQAVFGHPRLKPRNSAEDSLPLTMLQLTAKRPIKVVRASFWLPIGTLEDLKKAEELLKR